MAKVCEFCRKTDDDQLTCGEWRTLENRNFHYFCVLFAMKLPQNGNDNEGISGFLMDDINKSLAMCKKLLCYLCKERGAAVLCAGPKCRRSFHLPCGMKNGYQFQFIDEYKAYCDKHCTITDNVVVHNELYECFICQEEMGVYNPTTSIPSCCGRGWYHRRCLQEWALNSGYALKCPSCGDKDEKKVSEYRNSIRKRGIYIPDQDSSWERTVNPYQSLLEKPNQCDADNCKSARGRNYVKDSGKWLLYLCQCCGSKGVHSDCRTTNNNNFVCSDCEIVPPASSIQGDLNACTSPVSTVDATVEENNGGEDAACGDQAEDALVLVETTGFSNHRRGTFVLRRDYSESMANPLGIEQLEQMRKDRLNSFLSFL